MYLFKKYVEVYTTMNLTKFFTAKNLLDEHHIPFKDTSTNNSYDFLLTTSVAVMYSYPVMDP